MGNRDKVDYVREFANFEQANAILEQDGQRLTQGEFAMILGVAEPTLSTHFKELRVQKENEEITANLRAISRRATNRVLSVVDSLKVETVKDAVGMGKIAYGAADRIGFSPQVATINMTQNNSQNVAVIPPMFSSDEAAEIKALLGEV